MNPYQPEITIERKHVDGDPRLLYPVIKVTPIFVAYTYTELSNHWGMWGALQFQNESLSGVPRYRALADVAASTVL